MRNRDKISQKEKIRKKDERQKWQNRHTDQKEKSTYYQCDQMAKLF